MKRMVSSSPSGEGIVKMKNIVRVAIFVIGMFMCSFKPYGEVNIINEYQPEATRYVLTTSDFGLLGVRGYTEYGVVYEDGIRDRESGIWGSGDFYADAECYEYYLDTDGQWWRCDGYRWQKWINVLGWHWSEVIYQDEPLNISQRMYKDDPTADLDGDTIALALMAGAVLLTSAVKHAFTRIKSYC